MVRKVSRRLEWSLKLLLQNPIIGRTLLPKYSHLPTGGVHLFTTRCCTYLQMICFSEECKFFVTPLFTDKNVIIGVTATFMFFGKLY